MGTLKRQSDGPLYSNTVIGTLAVDGWYSEEGHGRAAAPPRPLLTVPNVTAYQCTNFILYRLYFASKCVLMCPFDVALVVSEF